MSTISMKELVSYCKENGFIFQDSEIYGGLANSWDYGPLGVELKNNIKKAWWKKYIQQSENSHGIDAAILMNPKVWEASGHLASFSDPLMDCKSCKERFRADTIIAEHSQGKVNADAMTNDEMYNYIVTNKVKCPTCKASDFTNIRQFNMMFKTFRGVVEDSKNVVYLRPETAQGQYVNFVNVQRSLRLKVPFGIGQIGKAFRNEITPGNFTFRTIEFEQMEHQLFCKCGQDEEYYNFYKQKAMDFFVLMGLKRENLKFKDHEKLAHYAKSACDVEYLFPFGWGEINGTHNRTNFDLTRHQQYSGQPMEYMDPITNEKYIPYVVESTYGPDRILLAVLCEAYSVEKVNEEDRIVLKLSPALAPYKAAILPLIKKRHSEKAREFYNMITENLRAVYDDTASIGKRYRRQDEIGTPYCITIDDETINNGTVTVRERDTMAQITLPVTEVCAFLESKCRL